MTTLNEIRELAHDIATLRAAKITLEQVLLEDIAIAGAHCVLNDKMFSYEERLRKLLASENKPDVRFEETTELRECPVCQGLSFYKLLRTYAPSQGGR